MAIYALLVLGAAMLFWMGVLVVQAWRFRTYVQTTFTRPPVGRMPAASVLLPCKGVDKELAATLSAITSLDYPQYEVICAVESADDPACAFINEVAKSQERVAIRCVIARERAERCSQKILNLLAALEHANPASEVLAFLDSDAIPPAGWLRAMIAPLSQPDVGAVTGFRWYVPGSSWVGRIRCAWNNMALSILGGYRANFVWGGSVAMRREMFERLRIAERWRRALSEDFEITRAVAEAGLRLQFAPGALLPSDDEACWRGFWEFARRQLIITRVCHRGFWMFAGSVTFGYALALWLSIGFAVAAGVTGDTSTAVTLGLMAAALYGLAVGRGALQQRAVDRMLGCLTSGVSRFIHVWGSPLLVLLNCALVAASGVSNRFWWRGIRYEMRAIDDVRVLARRELHPQQAAVLASGSAE